MFEVPGWSVGAAPVQEVHNTPSKKRKRPTSEHLEVNFDKIMEKLKSTVGVDEKKRDKSPKKNKAEKKKRKDRSKSGVSNVTALNISRPKPLRPRVSVDEELTRPAKKAKTHKESVSPTTIASTLTLAPSTSTSSATKLTPMQQGMKQSLDGARFRSV